LDEAILNKGNEALENNPVGLKVSEGVRKGKSLNSFLVEYYVFLWDKKVGMLIKVNVLTPY